MLTETDLKPGLREYFQVKDFKPGMTAFLPFYGKLRKSKILGMDGPVKTALGNMYSVRYQVVSDPLQATNVCVMYETSNYEVLVRKIR